MWILLLQSCIYSYKLESTFTSNPTIFSSGFEVLIRSSSSNSMFRVRALCSVFRFHVQAPTTALCSDSMFRLRAPALSDQSSNCVRYISFAEGPHAARLRFPVVIFIGKSLIFKFSVMDCTGSELSAVSADLNSIAFIYLICQNQACASCLDILLNIALERTGTVGRIVGSFRDKGFGLVGEADSDAALCQTEVES